MKQNAFDEGKNTIFNELTFIYFLPGGNFHKSENGTIRNVAMEAGANTFISKPLFASTLYNTLVSVVDNKPSNGLTENGQSGSIRNFTGKRFLLVEDNDLNGEIATELLTMTGVAIEWAHDGQEAVDMFIASKEGRYDLVLMDIQMPRMNGYEATRTPFAQKNIPMHKPSRFSP